MKRRLLNLLTALSLLLCVAVCVLWVRSFHGGHQLTWARSSIGETTYNAQRIALLSADGSFLAYVEREGGDMGRTVDFRSDWTSRPGFSWSNQPDEFRRVDDQYVGIRSPTAGFGVGGMHINSSDGWWEFRDAVLVPHWAIVLLLGILPLLHLLYRFNAGRRLAAAGCRSCGYNLTGNVSGVCPECGTPAAGGTIGGR